MFKLAPIEKIAWHYFSEGVSLKRGIDISYDSLIKEFWRPSSPEAEWRFVDKNTESQIFYIRSPDNKTFSLYSKALPKENEVFCDWISKKIIK